MEPERGADGPGHPVEHDGGQQLVVGEAALDLAVAVAPGPPLLHDSGGQPDRRVGQAEGQGLGAGPLEVRVAALALVPARPGLRQRLLGLGQRRRPGPEVGVGGSGDVDADQLLGVLQGQGLATMAPMSPPWAPKRP